MKARSSFSFAPAPFIPFRDTKAIARIRRNFTPITMDELEDLLMEFGIMKKEDTEIIGKSKAA